MNNLEIKLVRHGQSLANTGELNPAEVGDHNIPLSKLGIQQARATGKTLGRDFIENALIYASPYRRTRETLTGILEGAEVKREDLRIYEDPRLREVEFGYTDVPSQQELRRTHGWFYYRFNGGESPADCYDRTSGFLEGLLRQSRRKQVQRILIVTHGLTIRCFVMRYLHLTVEQFDLLANPENAEIVTIESKNNIVNPQFSTSKWGVTGLRFYSPENEVISPKSGETSSASNL